MVPGAGGIPQIQRIPLPNAELLEEEPLYVNAKQYHRILKRRQARAKLEAEGRIPKERRVSILLILSLAPQKNYNGFSVYCRNICMNRGTVMR